MIGYKKEAIPYNGGNHAPLHHSALSSLLTSFPLFAPFIHPPVILSLLLLCVVDVCSFLSTVLTLARPHTGTQTDGRVCVYLRTCPHVSMSGEFPWFFAACPLYVCMSLCPERYSLSSLRIFITVSGQPWWHHPLADHKYSSSYRCASYRRKRFGLPWWLAVLQNVSWEHVMC